MTPFTFTHLHDPIYIYFGEREINVLGNANTSRGEFAVTIIDTDQTVPPDLVVKLRAIEGTYAVRVIPAAA
jgi:hypothetical protein